MCSLVFFLFSFLLSLQVSCESTTTIGLANEQNVMKGLVGTCHSTMHVSVTVNLVYKVEQESAI